MQRSTNSLIITIYQLAHMFDDVIYRYVTFTRTRNIYRMIFAVALILRNVVRTGSNMT